MLYYLHDKRREGETERLTSERVAWTEVLNMPTDDVGIAKAIMIDTAKAQARLKAEAGIKNTGRKSNDHVLTYSLAWHEQEQPGLTKAEMLRAAQESMRTIGADGHQAVVVCHTDTAHPHIHVIVNRVNPANGVMLSSSNDQLKLSQWAEAYERERGKIWCQARVANNARRAQGEYVRGNKDVPRQEFEQRRKAAANDNMRAAFNAADQAKTAALATKTRRMREAHTTQWHNLGATHQTRKAEIRKTAAQAWEPTRQKVAEAFRPAWRQLLERHADELRRFEQRERRLAGKINNAIRAITSRPASRRQDGDRNWLSAAFNFLASGNARRTAITEGHRRERGVLMAKERRETKSATDAIKAEEQRLLRQNRDRFFRERAQLIERQGKDKAAARLEWRSRNDERRAAFHGAIGRQQPRSPDDKHARPSPDKSQAQPPPRISSSEWANKQRAHLQSRHLDQQVWLERRQDRQRAELETKLAETYGPHRAELTKRTDELRRQMTGKGRVGSLMGRLTGADERARDEMQGIQNTLNSIEQREGEQRGAMALRHVEQQQRMQKRQETEWQDLEQRIAEPSQERGGQQTADRRGSGGRHWSRTVGEP